MFCPYCGSQNPEQANFCHSCGVKITDPTSLPLHQPRICQQCSLENDSQARFCQHCGTAMPPQSGISAAQPGYIPSPRVDYAGFWRRFVAFIIDAIILGIASSIIRLFSGSSHSLVHHQSFMSMNFINPLELMLFTWSGFASFLLGWMYYALLESSSKQATVGKMVLGIVVTDMNGSRISFLRATGRHFSKIISALILGIGYIMAGITARKQALHDMIANCLVLVRM